MTRTLSIISALSLMVVAFFLQGQQGIARGTLPAGEPAPRFEATDLSGAAVDGASLPAGPRIYAFWASWCRPCRAEVPELNRLNQEREALGARLYGIALDSGGLDEVTEAARQLGMEFPVLVGDDALARRYQVDVLPTTVVVGADGKVLAQLTGAVSAATVKALLQPAAPAPQGDADARRHRAPAEGSVAASTAAQLPASGR